MGVIQARPGDGFSPQGEIKKEAFRRDVTNDFSGVRATFLPGSPKKELLPGKQRHLGKPWYRWLC